MYRQARTITNQATAPHALDDDLLATSALLAGFWAAPPELVDRRQLLRRIDSKYVLVARRLNAIVERLAADYAALRVPGGCVATYRSLYFDTPELVCFHDHRRGRRIRHKIRIRQYLDRAVSFLEIKMKRGETITEKHRIEVPYGTTRLGVAERAFLRHHVTFADQLLPRLWIEYRRISLVGVASDERVTVDFDIDALSLDGVRIRVGQIAVIEVKQSGASLHTPVMRVLAAAGLRERSLSKYTAAVAMLEPDVRMNRLLPALRLLAGRAP
jgi:hypothetical protein